MDHPPPHCPQPHHDVSALAGPSDPSPGACAHARATSMAATSVPVVPRDATAATPASPRPPQRKASAGGAPAVTVLLEDDPAAGGPPATPPGAASGMALDGVERVVEAGGPMSAPAGRTSFLREREREESPCRAGPSRDGVVVPGSLRGRREAAAQSRRGQERRRRRKAAAAADGAEVDDMEGNEAEDAKAEAPRGSSDDESDDGRKRRRVDVAGMELAGYGVERAGTFGMMDHGEDEEMVIGDDEMQALPPSPHYVLPDPSAPAPVRRSGSIRRLLSPAGVTKLRYGAAGGPLGGPAGSGGVFSHKSRLAKAPLQRQARKRAASLPSPSSPNPFASPSPRRRGKGKRASAGGVGLGPAGEGVGLGPYKAVDFAVPAGPPSRPPYHHHHHLDRLAPASSACSSFAQFAAMGAVSSSTPSALSSSQTLPPKPTPTEESADPEQDQQQASSYVPPFVEIHDPSSPSGPTPVPVTASAPPHVQIMTRHAVDLPREPMYAMPVLGSSSAAAGGLHGAQMVRIPGGRGPGIRDQVAVLPPASSSAAAVAVDLGEGTSSSQGQKMVVSPLIHVPAWQPPITKASMAELELTEVLKNAQLRHDVVFDDGLRFRPNLDGDRGERKRLVADRYWIAIEQEIVSGCRCTAFVHLPSTVKPSRAAQLRELECVCEGGLSSGIVDPSKPGLLPLSRIPSRLTGMIVELRNILLSLLPPSPPPTAGPLPSEVLRETPTRTHDLINAVLEPTSLTADLEAGTLDLASLAGFLGLILKNHCAPMRDVLVDNMIGLIANQQAEYVVEADSPHTINLEGLLGRQYVGLTGGLRLCFEVLELMKLDIANHQLRTLRPLLLESAVDFEIKQFKELLRRKPGLERTKRWYLGAASRLSVPPGVTPYEDIFAIVREGLVDLVFAVEPATKPPSSSHKAVTAPSAAKKDLSPSPSSSVVPETFHMDTTRMQNMHSDLADITIAYLLLMLFKQVAGHNNIREGDIDVMKAEIWTFMSDSVLKARGSSSKGRPGPGIKKLELSEWRFAMRNVILQVGARAQAVRERGKAEELPPLQPPSGPLLATLNSWLDNHLRTSSKLFGLARSRLRQAVDAVLAEQMQSQMSAASNQSRGAPAQLRTGRATSAAHVQEIATSMARRAKASASSTVTTVPPVRTRKRSLVEREDDLREQSGDEAGEKRSRVDGSDRPVKRPASPTPSEVAEQEARARSRQESRIAVETFLSRNGLTHLAPEIRVVAVRMGKLLGFHLRAFRDLYRALPIPDSVAPTTPPSPPRSIS